MRVSFVQHSTTTACTLCLSDFHIFHIIISFSFPQVLLLLRRRRRPSRTSVSTSYRVFYSLLIPFFAVYLYRTLSDADVLCQRVLWSNPPGRGAPVRPILSSVPTTFTKVSAKSLSDRKYRPGNHDPIVQCTIGVPARPIFKRRS